MLRNPAVLFRMGAAREAAMECWVCLDIVQGLVGKDRQR